LSVVAFLARMGEGFCTSVFPVSLFRLLICQLITFNSLIFGVGVVRLPQPRIVMGIMDGVVVIVRCSKVLPMQS
jgi:hypothetical protein